MNEAPGPINFTMFLTMFGEKLNGTDPEDVIRNAFACFDEEGTGELKFSIHLECALHFVMLFLNVSLNQMLSECFCFIKNLLDQNSQMHHFYTSQIQNGIGLKLQLAIFIII